MDAPNTVVPDTVVGTVTPSLTSVGVGPSIPRALGTTAVMCPAASRVTV